MEDLLMDCISELCLKCGRYETAHNGSCNSCRWYKLKTEGYKRDVDTMLVIAEDLVVNCEAEECYRIEIDEAGNEHKYPSCPFLDRDGGCKIEDPTSWRI